MLPISLPAVVDLRQLLELHGVPWVIEPSKLAYSLYPNVYMSGMAISYCTFFSVADIVDNSDLLSVVHTPH